MDEEINDFYRRIKLKGQFNDNATVKEQIEENFQNKTNPRRWFPNNNHAIKTFIEVTQN